MATRQRRSSRSDDTELFDDEFSEVSEEDILAYMAEVEAEVEEEEQKKDGGFLNLQTGAGLGLIALGGLYTMQLLGLLGVPSTLLPTLVAIMPWLAGILIILTGFGVLSWSPAARRRRKARERAIKAARRRRQKTMGRKRNANATDEAGRRARRAFEQAERAAQKAGRRAKGAVDASRARTRSMTAGRTRGRRLAKSRKLRKISGVASGIAEYFGVDPTVIRIAFVLATIFGQGMGVILYLILSFVLPDGKPKDDDDPIIARLRDD
ncbi:MAG: PspC domain-containing protein [Bacteroidota bacterium]